MGRRQFGSVRRLPSGRWQARYWTPAGDEHTAPQTFATKGAAVEADVIVRSPCRGVKLPAARRRERPTLTADDLHRLAVALPEPYRPVVYVGGVLGLRWSEVAGLRVRHLDFLRRALTVAETIAEVNGRLQAAATKSRAAIRTLAVPPFLMDMLAAHLAASRGRPGHDELVFISPAGGRCAPRPSAPGSGAPPSAEPGSRA